jgi:hypothetical protein
MWGYRPHAEVMAAMARAAIIVVPSRWPEPFGLTALEVMAAGGALLCAAPRPAGGVRRCRPGHRPRQPCHPGRHHPRTGRQPRRLAALGEAGRARARLFDLPVAAARLDALRRQILTR